MAQGSRDDQRRPERVPYLLRLPRRAWIHLTTSPIDSTLATVRLLQRVTKGPGLRPSGVAMAFKLIEAAQARCGAW